MDACSLGQGRFLVALAFASALSCRHLLPQWLERTGESAAFPSPRLGPRLLSLHLVFVSSSDAHRYEFQYIWKHLNNEMPMRFILSAFWGGQEGGFLLVDVLAQRSGTHPSAQKTYPVDMVRPWRHLSAIQVFLTSMILGIYFRGFPAWPRSFLAVARRASVRWTCPGPQRARLPHGLPSLSKTAKD